MSITVKQHVDYWLNSAAENMVDMRANIKSKRRVAALFMGHLAVEKMLKALCAAKRKPVIKEHTLLKLAKRADLELTEEQMTELSIITKFNISARYDDYKLRFHKQCTPQFVKEWSAKIYWWYKWLKPMVAEERTKLPNNAPLREE